MGRFIRLSSAQFMSIITVIAPLCCVAPPSSADATGVAAGPDSRPGAESIPFDSDRWARLDTALTTHLGRPALAGTALLKDVEFEDGVIEVDIAVTGARSYPGIYFRMESMQNYERFYIRPHRTLYTDTLQYVPAYNGIDGWQLYNGDGYTAGSAFPTGEWVSVRLEVAGTQARVFIGSAEQPALRIGNLQHGVSRGTLGLNGPKDGSAYFSNFRFRPDKNLRFDAPPVVDMPPGMIRTWQLSSPFKASQIDRDRAPEGQLPADLKWQEVTSTPSGLVDVSRYFGRLGPLPDSVLAKAVVHAERDEVRKFRFGYSDEVHVFLNGTPLFSGQSSYRSRDPSFLGIIGLFDTVYLPLHKGDNELLLIVTEAFGGWGFMAQDATAVYQAAGIEKLWQTGAEFRFPESAAYDAARDVIYVSNYDPLRPSLGDGRQAISRLASDGAIREAEWVTGLKNPTGLAIAGDTLYAVEPTSLVEIDIPAAKVRTRHQVPGAGALNDVALGPAGTAYISDTQRNVIFRFADGQFEEWLSGPEVERPNGVLVHGGKLVFANNGDGCLKAADLETRKIGTLANLGAGLLDGLAADSNGDLLVSHNEGRLYRITAAGAVTKLLDTSVIEVNLADFAYVPAHKLVIAPTWVDQRVVAYQLGK